MSLVTKTLLFTKIGSEARHYVNVVKITSTSNFLYEKWRWFMVSREKSDVKITVFYGQKTNVKNTSYQAINCPTSPNFKVCKRVVNIFLLYFLVAFTGEQRFLQQPLLLLSNNITKY